jgi:hypothetical protein
MSQAGMANDGVFCFMVVLTLLLVMFIYAVISTPPEPADSPEPPVLKPAAPPSPPPLPVRPRATTPPSGAADQSGDAGYAARHASAAVPVIEPPKVSGGPPWGPASMPPGMVR